MVVDMKGRYEDMYLVALNSLNLISMPNLNDIFKT